jgi:rare lipoprotein A
VSKLVKGLVVRKFIVGVSVALICGVGFAQSTEPVPSTPEVITPTVIAESTPNVTDTEVVPTESPTMSAPTAPVEVSESTSGWQERGIASWYGPRFHGRKTANGERFDQNAMTAAHKTLPFGTRVRVTSMITGKQIVVRINDRGPFIRGRVIDLSKAAAQLLGMPGVKQVLVERLK